MIKTTKMGNFKKFKLQPQAASVTTSKTALWPPAET